MLTYLLQGFGFGLAAAAQPGPFQTYIVSQTLSQGWRRTLPAALAPLVSDGPIILVSLVVLSRVPAWFQRFLYLTGGLFILYLAYVTFLTWRHFKNGKEDTAPTNRLSVFRAALTNAMSPGPYIYWSLVMGPILLVGWREAPAKGIGFIASFYCALILSLAAIILAFGTARRLGPKVNRSLLAISAAALFFFGLYQLWRGFTGG
jgi:threonine/homoserine/homoserine lactone efflux protein